jgi:L-tartrate/succinate antiporter
MFLTALAPNLLAVEFISGGTGHLVSWVEWATIMFPLMLPAFLLTPWLVYIIYPPGQKYSPEAPEWADKELKSLGRVTKKEVMMASLAGIALILWIFGERIGIHATTTAISVVAVMVLFNVITWEDVISKKEAFNILIWFASLVAMASGLEKVGILSWIGTNSEAALTNMSPVLLIISMLLLFYVLHYFFASTTAHTTALMPLFVAVAVNVLEPGQLIPFLILLAGSLGIMGILTPYATGPSPIWYGAGYISQSRWWGMGAIFGAIYFIFLLTGSFIFL